MMDDEKFQRLCQSQIEGVASDGERAELASLLKASDEARRSYADQMRIHAMLAWQHGHARPAVVESSPAPKKAVRFPQRHWLALAAAVAVLCGLSAMWFVRSSHAGVEFEVLAASTVSYQAGEQARRETIEIEQGSLSFRLRSGAVVDVTGPVAVRLISPMHLRLLRGSLTADVGKDAKGFIVDTEEARVVDLGTRFGVTTGTANKTDVVVFEGSVEVYQPSPGSSATPDVTLIEGEAVRCERSQKPRRLRMVPLGKGARTLRARAAADIVSSVTDNVTDESVRGYYGLVRGGMGEGARVYTTGHTRTWHPLPGEIFPDELAGADGICTFGMDGKEANLQVTLQITRPCDLYVMADARAPAPEWLQREFVDTGHQLRSGPWISHTVPKEDYARFHKDETAYVPCRVWKKHIASPGTVVLGSPLAQATGRSPAMYGIAVKEHP